MGILRLPFFVILLFASVCTLAFDGYKSSEQTLSEVQTALRRDGISRSVTKSEEAFRAEASAHRLRLSEIFLEISKDKDFLKEFPQFKPLVKNQEQTVKILLQHDLAKSIDVTKSAVQTLGLLKGYDYRYPNKGLSPDTDAIVRKAIKNAVDDINSADKAIIDHVVKSNVLDPVEQKLHESLAETLDFYDTYKSRQNEMAKNGRKLEPPSKWFDSKDNETRNADTENKAFKKQFAEYLERKDPIGNNPQRFSQPSKFSNLSSDEIASKFKKESNLIQGRSEKPSSLFSSSSAAGSKVAGNAETLAGASADIAKGIGKTLGKNVAGTAVVSGAIYAVSPESVSGTDAVNGTGFAYSKKLGYCESAECLKFAKVCAHKLNLEYDGDADKFFSRLPSFEFDENPNFLNKKVKVKNLGFEECLNHFYDMSLEIQSKMRQDGDLNRLFGKYTPDVRNLTCKKDSDTLAITTTTLQPDAVVEGKSEAYIDQQIHYDNLGNLTKITRKDEVVFYHNMEPTSLQKCTGNSNCKSTLIKEIREKKQYFWRKDELEPYRWVLNNEKLIKKQNEALKACCDSKRCLDYFANAPKVSQRPDLSTQDVKRPGNLNNPGGKTQGSR